MMRLHWSPRSPFVRKVMIVLHECGLQGQVELVRSVAVFHAAPNPAILADNPLGKIPALITEDGRKLFDSRVICEYLIERSGCPALLPGAGAGRVQMQTWQALGDGLTDILLLWRNERLRGDAASPVLLDAFRTKTLATLKALDAGAGDLLATPFGLGHAAILCALGQLDFRFAGCGWRAAFPALAHWCDALAARPSIAATAIENDDADSAEPPAFSCETK
ncbi:glutathione S-transferase family protein [Frigidibacter mobilis]|uniref:Glutathione S-transferase n=1 Tax=Frigidibacter mobilis TaxID=1335048 RepID=A0A159Z6P3_9RHOB|nr:glutathione S-transferase [Frigidibacter mobilis]AMY71035.1 glutathione S-transferase [Frigidibacter mobilis]